MPATRPRLLRSYKTSVKTIDIIADKRIVHKNKAARHKSRLAAAIKGLQAPAAQ